jgi:penicillin-binding protein 1A
VLYQAQPHADRAVSEATAYLISTMLADVINAGTAWQARRVGFTLPAAGKTGTTNDYRDAWFIGYTPHLVAGVWVGYDQPRTIIGSGYAGDIAVPLWGRFMTAATRGDEPTWFRSPATVTTATICRLSGKLPTEGCRHAPVLNADGSVSNRSMVYDEYFVRGTEPAEICPLHGSIFPGVLATSGQLPEPAPPTAPPAVTAAGAPGAVAPPVVTGGILTAGSAEEPAAVGDAPTERKRGFWSRVFGRRGSDDKKDEEQRRQEERRRDEEGRRQQR